MAPVYITYFIKGKTIEKSTDIKIMLTQWDAKNQKIVKHSDAKRLQNKLDAIKRGYDEAIADYDGVITPDVLRKLLNGETVGRPNPQKTDFIQYARKVNESRYNNNKIGYSVYYNTTLYLNKFERFIESKLGVASIPISELTKDLIDEYKDERRSKVCQATLNKEIVPIIKAIDNAVKNGLIEPSKFGDLYELYVGQSRAYGDKVDEDETDIHYLTRDQMTKFVEYYS